MMVRNELFEALEAIERRMQEIDAAMLVPQEAEDEALELFLEYIELDAELDRRSRDGG
jgi:hypothetical protein